MWEALPGQIQQNWALSFQVDDEGFPGISRRDAWHHEQEGPI